MADVLDLDTDEVTKASESWQNYVVSPTVLQEGPYRFFFYSADRHEPRHIHVERDANRAKFWLDPVRLARSGGFGPAELRDIEHLVAERAALLMEKWDDYFRNAE